MGRRNFTNGTPFDKDFYRPEKVGPKMEPRTQQKIELSEVQADSLRLRPKMG
jgi:hypothetical protein